ncbi:pentatricopeptide repeat-containing protein MRL1, chloroplastic isoform X1 [Lycium ferocissimum]|uniref:pentatricopeptide repeat-containing protein MRL1, chloroplastic isoform X1 n=1 Tax=Lycium ferocissimum TaxID=112874 RepID=UPI002815919E|nr:pentatricopeptide repeat-containing protein MRL1, chloroplastic isoform X1 [Lycium ferocissimum]
MDSTIFSPKPLTRSLISCSPISSSLIPRRQFLAGYSHNLLPPGGLLRSRRKCRNNIGFQFCSKNSRFVLKASLDSQTVVVVASVVTISALSIVFFEFNKRNNDNANAKFKEISAELTHALRRQIRHVMNWFPRHVFALINIQEEKPVKNQMKEVTKVSNECEDGGTNVLQHGGTSLKQTFITNKTESPDTNQLAHSSDGSLTSGAPGPNEHTESDAVPSSFVAESNNIYLQENLQGTKMSHILTTEEVREPGSNSHTESDAVPSSLVAESNNIYLQEHLHEAKMSNILTAEQVSSERSVALFPAINIDKRIDESMKMDPELMRKDGCKKAHKLVAEDEVNIHNLIFRDSARKELYSFFEASTKSLNGQEALTSHASLQHIGVFSAPLKVSSVRAEALEEKRLHGCYKKGPSNKNDFAKRKHHFTKKEKSILPDNGTTKQFQIPNPKGIQVCDGPHPSDQFRTYRHFLREGRLMDCIEILEDMGRRGSLNMDKVYHAGFFQVCKSQKAVKEAFRFTKLIQNPTLSTFNMLLSVCASSRDLERAFQVLQLVRETGLKPDCKLYTTLISTCAKAGKVDTMFEVFHEMVNAGVEPNANTYGTLIDGCAKAGQVAKAFGAYGIMRSKNVKPDRVVFNALITACGQSGAVDRAFDVLAEMRAEARPIEPDQITIGALMKACANAGQVDRALEVYRMIDKCDIKGTPEVYTIAVNCCSQSGNWELACSIYDDMSKKGVNPDEMFISALIDVAGHTGKLDAAFEVLEEARTKGINVGSISYSSLMGACCNAKNWQKALELYEDIKGINLKPTVSMMNALITTLCYADQYQKALEIFSEMKRVDLCPNTITYSTLLVASEKKDDLDIGLMLLSHAKKDGVAPNLVMCRCLLAMCLRRFQKACTLGEPVMSYSSGRLQLDSKWTSLALMVYRETIAAGVVPTMEELSLVLGCLQLPRDASLKERLIENLGLTVETTKVSNLCSLVDGFCEYDPRAFSLLEEAASLGIIPLTSFKGSPIVVDVRNLHIHAAQVYLLTVLKALKHRLAAGAKIPNISILLPVAESHIQTPTGEKTIKIAGRINQAIASLLRRLGLPYPGNESCGKIRINGVIVKRWFQPKFESPFSWKHTGLSFSPTRLRKGISHQQRDIRAGNLSLD